LRSLVPRKRPDQAELFKSYFRDDKIAPFTEAEHKNLADFERCVACGLCPSRCRVMELAPDRFLGPMHIAVTVSRSQPEFLNDMDSIILCAVCGQCEPICPEGLPIAQITQAMREMIWRVAPESLPGPYHEAAENLRTHGNVYGPEPEMDLPVNANASSVLVLGPGLRLDPEKAGRAADTLRKLGYEVTAVVEGAIRGVAGSMGLDTDTRWLEDLAGHGARQIIAADPATWIELLMDERLKGKQVRFILEAVTEKIPAGFSLSRFVKGSAVVHDPPALGRRSSMWRFIRGLLYKWGVELSEMELHGEWSPPAGWEGGLNLVDPALAGSLARARIGDALSAGAKFIITFSAEDALILGEACQDGDISVIYFMDLINQGIGQ